MKGNHTTLSDFTQESPEVIIEQIQADAKAALDEQEVVE